MPKPEPIRAPRHDELIDDVVKDLLGLGYTAEREGGPSPTEIEVHRQGLHFGFMVVDQGDIAPAVAYDDDGPIESGPVADVLADHFMPEGEPYAPEITLAIKDTVDTAVAVWRQTREAGDA